MYLRTATIKAVLDLQSEQVDLTDLIVGGSVSIGGNDRISRANLVLNDSGLTLANKIQERAVAEGGMLVPRSLFSSVEAAANPGNLSDIQNGIQGDALYSLVYAFCLKNGITNKHHIAYILATIKHESNGGIYVKEIGNKERFTRLYESRSDLGNTEPGDGAKYPGYGLVQTTGRRNAQVNTDLLGVDFIAKPELQGDLKYAIPIAVIRMREGSFTGRRLSQYDSSSGGFDYVGARWIINGTDRAELIAGYGREFYNRINTGELQPDQAVQLEQTLRVTAKESLQTVKQGQANTGFGVFNVTLGQELTASSEAQIVSETVVGYPVTVTLGSNDPVITEITLNYFLTGYSTNEERLTLQLSGLAGRIHTSTQVQEITVFRNITLYGLAQRIAKQFGIPVDVKEKTLASKVLTLVKQLKGESLYQLLVRTARLESQHVRIVQNEEGRDTLVISPLYSKQSSLYLKEEWFLSLPTFSDTADSNRIIRQGLPSVVEGLSLDKTSETQNKLAILGQQTNTRPNTYIENTNQYAIGEGFLSTCTLTYAHEIMSLNHDDVVTIPAEIIEGKSLVGEYRVRKIDLDLRSKVITLSMYLPVWVEKAKTENTKPVTPLGSAQAQEIVTIAESFVGTRFNGDATEQCAIFVRTVLKKAGLNPKVTLSPLDTLPTGEALASSFFGSDMGTLIPDKANLIPGDVVCWNNTYGNFSETIVGTDGKTGTITHVAIYVGNGLVVDRPTASKPVQKRSIDTFAQFRAGIRLTGIS